MPVSLPESALSIGYDDAGLYWIASQPQGVDSSRFMFRMLLAVLAAAHLGILMGFVCYWILRDGAESSTHELMLKAGLIVFPACGILAAVLLTTKYIALLRQPHQQNAPLNRVEWNKKDQRLTFDIVTPSRDEPKHVVVARDQLIGWRRSYFNTSKLLVRTRSGTIPLGPVGDPYTACVTDLIDAIRNGKSIEAVLSKHRRRTGLS